MCMCVNSFACVNVFVCVCKCVHVCACVCMCVHVCACVCKKGCVFSLNEQTSTYTHTHTHTHTLTHTQARAACARSRANGRELRVRHCAAAGAKLRPLITLHFPVFLIHPALLRPFSPSISSFVFLFTSLHTSPLPTFSFHVHTSHFPSPVCVPFPILFLASFFRTTRSTSTACYASGPS